MSDATVVGSAAFELRATRDKLKQDIAQSEADLKGFGDRAERDLGGSGSRIGAAIGKMAATATLAIGALAAVFGLAATEAFKFSFAAMGVADAIGNSAKRIGIGTDALQEWRFVAQKTSSDAKSADAALDSFATKLAQATAGTSKEAVKAFGLLQFGPEQLRGFKSVEQALDTVVDRIKNLKSEADRTAAAEAVGLGGLSNALRDSAIDVAALRDQARSLGFVMDQEMIQRASEAQDKFDTLSKVIDIDLKSAFVDLAPALLTAIGLIADLARSLGDALDQWRDLESKTSRGIRRADQKQGEEQKALVDQFGSPQAMRGQIVRARPIEGEAYTPLSARQSAAVLVKGAPNTPSARSDPTLNFWENLGRNSSNVENVPQYVDAYEHFQALNRSRTRNATELTDREIRSTPTRTDRPTGGTLTIPPPKARVDRTAEREARRAEKVEQEVYKARERLLGVVDRELQTVQERFDTEKAQTAIAREAEKKQLESRLARKDITDEEFKQLDGLRIETATQEDRISSQLLARDLADERLAQERAMTDLTADLLSLQSSAARTAGERKAIELRLLAIAQQKAREDLDIRMERDPTLKGRDDIKQQRRDALALVHKAQSDAVDRSNLTPLEAWRDAALKNAAEVRQAYEGIAANGLDALNSGIVDAIMNTRSLGDVFSNVARQIIADLASIEIRRSITEPLSRMLFGGGSSSLGDAKAAARAAKGLGGESGGWLSKIFGAGKSFFGFSSGGYTGDGGKYDPAGLVHKGEYVLPQEAVSRIGVSRLDALRAGAFPGFADGGLVGMPAMPSMSVGGLGAGNLARPQKLFVQIDFNDPMFRARVRNEAMPLVAQGAAATYEATKADTMETLASQQTYTRR